jgi:peroxiredoxin Q/BCP|tara:strand:- start:99 stop:290 length:192 start_codon:yes stop_codon:yes gene_type:complete
VSPRLWSAYDIRISNEKGISMLEVGTVAPAFSAPDQNGIRVSSDDLAGSWVALWWYPKASTPG